MGFRVYFSVDLEALAKRLSADTSKNNFEFNHIVVQTQGLRRWLNIKLADYNSVSIFNKFYTPNDIIDQLFELADLQPDNSYRPRQLVWKIFDKIEASENQSIKNYIKDSGTKKFALSFTIADLFDQYQIYRSEMIKSWNPGKLWEGIEEKYKNDEKWQMDLWQHIKKEIDSKDRTELIEDLKTKFDNKEFLQKIKSELSSLHIFGFSFFTPFHLDILMNYLPKAIDVSFYFFNPAPEVFWYDQISEKRDLFYKKTGRSNLNYEVGNQLLVNLGKVAKETVLMMNQVAGDEFWNALETIPAEQDFNRTLLGKIQKSIFDGKIKTDTPVTTDELTDGSLIVSGSYSKHREVEAVYNFILSEMEKGIKPHEILVMTTNIDEYSPYIKAVFGNYLPYSTTTDPDKLKIPYEIADLSYTNEENLITYFNKILSLNEDSFNLETVLGLLNYEPISGKYGIENADELIPILTRSGILKGLKGKNENDTRIISWEYGLKRLALSYAMNYDDVVEFSGDKIITLPQVEGSIAFDILRFIDFAKDLIGFIVKQKKQRTLQEWTDIAKNILNTLFDTGSNEEKDLTYILNALEELAGTYPEEVSYDTFIAALDKIIIPENFRGKRFITGKVTFSSMVPLRSVPFKTICILGLNNENFPRLDNKISFNLIHTKSILGDRNNKKSDNYLFLETLMSATNHLYLSYISKNIKTDEPLPPSVVIEEIYSFIERNIKDPADIKKVKEKLFVQHPLHLYSSKYNKDDKYTNYINIDFESELQNVTGNNTPKETPENNISLWDIRDFYKNPSDWFHKKILNIYGTGQYDRIGEDALAEEEIIDLGNLERYNVYVEIWNRLTNNKITDEKLKLQLKLKRELPLSKAGDLKYEDLYNKLSKKLHETGINVNAKKRNLETTIDYEFDKTKFHIDIRLEDIYDDTLMIFSPSKTSSFAMTVLLTFYAWAITTKETGVNKILLITKEGNDLQIYTAESDSFEKLKNVAGTFLDVYLKYYIAEKYPLLMKDKLKEILTKKTDCSKKNITEYVQKNIENLMHGYGQLLSRDEDYINDNDRLCRNVIELKQHIKK